MIVLGVDPGSVRLGWGVIDTGETGLAPVHVADGVLTATAGHDKFARAVELWGGLQRLLDRYRPDVAGVEAGFVGMQMGALVSGGIRAIVALACNLRGVPVREYAPSSVKKCAAGYGRAEKPAVAAAVAQLLGLDRPPRPDAADALAVAITRARDTGPAR